MQLPTLKEWRDFNEKMANLQLQNDNYKVQLEKYTNNDRHKRYYEQNKDRVKENAKAYLDRLKTENPNKLKEYRHRAYLKRNEGKMVECFTESPSDIEKIST